MSILHTKAIQCNQCYISYIIDVLVYVDCGRQRDIRSECSRMSSGCVDFGARQLLNVSVFIVCRLALAKHILWVQVLSSTAAKIKWA